jgi:hypothetical protein
MVPALPISSSFSIESLSTSYSLIGYTSPGGSISIPSGFYLSATNVNLFNFIKIVTLKAAVTVGNGFSFVGVIEKSNFGLLKLEHPTNSSAGPAVSMALTPTSQSTLRKPHFHLFFFPPFPHSHHIFPPVFSLR